MTNTEVEDADPKMRTVRSRVASRAADACRSLADASSRLLQKPLPAVLLLLAVALVVEVGQYFSEAFPGAHAIGEVVRNLAYALVGAVIFSWLVVEIPARRRRRATYAFHEETFRVLVTMGPGLLKQYEVAAGVLNEDLDIWDQASLNAVAAKLNAVSPAIFGSDRAGLVKTVLEIGLPRALTDLSRSAAYLDLDVAHALSRFPLRDGLTNVLQVRRTPSGGVEAGQDAYITWSLLEAARRLYPALLDAGAYDTSIFRGAVGKPPNMVVLTPDVLTREEQD
jgi:hypothetical protein